LFINDQLSLVHCCCCYCCCVMCHTDVCNACVFAELS